MTSTYEIEITGVRYSAVDLDGENLEGDRRELSSDSTTVIADDDDLAMFEDAGNPAHVAWAVHVIDTTTDAIHPSGSPVPDEIPEHWWLSGTYVDPYDNTEETETSVRLTGDWTPRERATVFLAFARKYHTA